MPEMLARFAGALPLWARARRGDSRPEPSSALPPVAVARWAPGRMRLAAGRRTTAPSQDEARGATWAALKTLLGERRKRVAALVVSGLLSGLVEAAILALIAQVAAAMVDGSDHVSAQVGPAHVGAGLGVTLTVAGALAVVRLALGFAIAYLPAHIAGDTEASLRQRLFDAYSRTSWRVRAEERDGALQELVTNQVTQATKGVIQATNLVSGGMTFAVLVLAAFLLSPLTALLVLVVALALFALMRPLSVRGRFHGKQLSAAQLSFGGGVGEAVRLAEETFTFGTMAAERTRVNERIETARRHFARRELSGGLVTNLYQGLVILLLVGGLAGLYVAGADRIASLGAVVLMLIRSAQYGQRAQSGWQQVQQAAPFLDRIGAAVERYRGNAEPAGHLPFARGAPLQLHNVSFSYISGVQVLTDVDLDIEPGEALGIAGASGSGKSTLLQVLLRMRTPETGSYLLGDTPVADVAIDDWRRHVAYVPQEPRLLHATVASNIRYFRDIDDATVERAARLAHIHDDIAAMPAGYDTIIGQRADAVSGGQRQRICVARALAGEPSVLVLDEPTSALDLASEVAIQEALTMLQGQLTLVIVTHRPSLLSGCDRVLTVERSSVSERDPVLP